MSSHGKFTHVQSGDRAFQNFIFAVLGFFLFYYLFFVSDLRYPLLRIFFDSSPIWLATILVMVFIQVWMHWRRGLYLRKQGSTLLEIKLPKEITKSPAAMELVYTALYQTGSASYVETYIGGKVRPWFSFEMISEEGRIRFFIWTHKKFKDLIESQIYAQYPNVEIHVVPPEEDYVHKVPHLPIDLPIWGTWFVLGKPSVYPLKTYIDYGLSDNPKEEHKIDPMTSVLEYMGSMRKGETVWIQILFQAHKKLGLKEGHLFNHAFWTGQGQEEINKILVRSVDKGSSLKHQEDRPGVPPIVSENEKAIANAIERKIAKWPFECGIRGFYISTKEAFNPVSITGLIGSFRQYSAKDLNEIKLGWFTDFDYPWQDYKRIRRTKMEGRMLNAYKKRALFQGHDEHFHTVPFILNTEELATIYHFPGEVATTPTFSRIPSKKVQPPSNLPI